MPCHAAAALQGRAEDRIADVGRDVQDGAEVLRLFWRQPFIVDAGQAIGINVPLNTCTSWMLWASIMQPRGEYMTL